MIGDFEREQSLSRCFEENLTFSRDLISELRYQIGNKYLILSDGSNPTVKPSIMATYTYTLLVLWLSTDPGIEFSRHN